MTRGEGHRRGRAAAASPGAGQAVSLEVRIPPLGESITEGTIGDWLKRDGDTVKADETLFVLETDKATVEMPAPAAGRLEIVEPEGATVRVGTVVARIAEATPAARSSTSAAGSIAAPAPASAERRAARRADPGRSTAATRGGDRRAAHAAASR